MKDHTHRPVLRALLIAGALAAAPLLAACSDSDKDATVPATPTAPTISMPMPSASAQVPNADEVSPAAAKQLCDMINPEIDKWRTEGVAVGRVSFNGTVHNWALRNGGLNDAVLTDRGIVDRLTTQNCPEVRQRAIEALGTDDLASALAGFGG